ncbi:hypothetical protein [Streptomyces sp. NPDC020965]|uniref:hypothetical protein n=1 Tax=Streptomyces sp. NPDC020965 TaxID=3365105 RepID=UPI0037AC407D
MWFLMPPGYYSISEIEMADLERTISALLKPVLDDPSAVEDALRDAHASISLLRTMREHGGVHTAFGMHPDDRQGTSVSVFCLSMIKAAPSTSNLLAVRAGLAAVNSPLWSGNTCRRIELPIGTAALVTGSLAAPTPATMAQRGIVAEASEVFQARLTVPCPDGTHLAVADLTSAATHLAQSYTGILEGIAQTMTFTPPLPTQPVDPSSQRASRILDVLS